MSELKLTTIQSHWLEHVKKASLSDLSQKAYAEQNNLDANAFYNWKSIFVRKGLFAQYQPAERFVKAEIVAKTRLINAPQEDTAHRVQVALPNGVRLFIDRLTSETLKDLSSL